MYLMLALVDFMTRSDEEKRGDYPNAGGQERE